MSCRHLSFPGARGLLVLLLTLPVVASAHTRFLMSDPAPDDTLSTPPQAVQLWFSHPVEADFSRIGR